METELQSATPYSLYVPIENNYIVYSKVNWLFSLLVLCYEPWVKFIDSFLLRSAGGTEKLVSYSW
jgi:hypothetical protein